MKVLLSLAACSPTKGSEPQVGWVWLLAVAAEHDVILLCSDYDFPELKAAQQAGMLSTSVELVPCGQPIWSYSKNRFIARLQTWKRFAEFNRHSTATARKILEKHHIDLIHQVTIETWRTGCPLISLNKPFVWGPIGGAEIFPIRYLTCLTPSSLFLETGRAISGWLSSLNSLTRRTACEASAIIVTNENTATKLKKLGRHRPIIRCPNLLDAHRYERIRELASSRTRNPGLLRIFCGGTLEGRKGFVLALRAVSRLKESQIPFHFTFGGHGPDSQRAQRLAESLGLKKQVSFAPNLSGDEYLAHLVNSDVFLFPSLRDNSPMTLVEAMAAECLPIVLKANGPGETVTPQSGIVLDLSTPKETVEGLASALGKCWNELDWATQTAASAALRVKDTFLITRASYVLGEAYKVALNRYN